MTLSRRLNTTSLSIAVSGDEPPTEFRVFTAGKVVTTKGVFLFDDVAAKSVMADYAAHGIDLMLDYDHASLASFTLDPAQTGKAAGWFNLELRNGELWAVNVRWTPPAADALRRKEWRFMSPAFSTDEAGRVTSLLNVAITNLPATRQLEPLMAASVTALGENGMDPKLIKEALDALIAGDEGKCADLLKSLVASAAGAEPAAEEPAPEPVAEMAAMAPEEEKPAEVAAAASKLMRLSGKTSLIEAIAQAEIWRTSHLTLETETQKLAAERATLEAAERRKGCIELVTLAGRSPATVWETPESKAPKKYLAEMPIGSFRDYVADAIKASGSKPRTPVPPPPASGAKPDAVGDKEFITPHGAVTLRADQISECKKLGVDVEVYAANVALMNKAKARGSKE